MRQTVDFVCDATKALGDWGIFLAGDGCCYAWFVIVARVLNSKPPLIAQINLAHSFRAEGTIDLAGTGISLLGCACVLHTTAIANQIITCGLSFSVVACSKLHDTIALIFCHFLHRRQQVIKGTIYPIGRWGQARCGRLWRHGCRNRRGRRRSGAGYGPHGISKGSRRARHGGR